MGPGKKVGHWSKVRAENKVEPGNKVGPNFKPIRITFSIFRTFIKFAIMGRIWIDLALLNTFANCDFYLFFEFLTFS